MRPPKRFDLVFGFVREWKSDDVDNLLYMIQDDYYDSSLYKDEILYLLSNWDAEDCMGMFHWKFI